MSKESIDLISIVISAGSFVVAGLALLMASSAEQRALANVKTKTFLTFRERFHGIKHDLPPRWSANDWLPQRDSVEWRGIEQYWQNAFDEWFVPTRLNEKYLKEVWSLFFERVVKGRHPLSGSPLCGVLSV